MSSDAVLDNTAPCQQAQFPPEQCAVLVLVGGHIEQRCERGSWNWSGGGYNVRQLGGYANIDLRRSQVTTDALAAGALDILWIDADVAFLPDDVERLRGHGLPLVCGLFPKKGLRELAAQVLPETREIVFGREGGLLEIKYVIGGFLLARCEVFERL